MKLIILLPILVFAIQALGQSHQGIDSIKKPDSSNHAQQTTSTKKIDCNPLYDSISQREVYFVTDPMPEFPGGMNLLFKYIANNLEYPPIAREGSIQGRVYIRFIVETTGKITNIKVFRGIDPFLDKLAIQVVKGMPDWIPGQCNGKKVPAYFTVPITFKLQ